MSTNESKSTTASAVAATVDKVQALDKYRSPRERETEGGGEGESVERVFRFELCDIRRQLGKLWSKRFKETATNQTISAVYARHVLSVLSVLPANGTG